MSSLASLSAQARLALAASVGLFAAGCNAQVVKATTSLARRLQPLETVEDITTQSGIMLAAYVLQYLVLGGLFEGTNAEGVLSSKLPPSAVAQRRSQVASEVRTGVVSLLITVVIAVCWMAFVEPHLWTFAYFETHTWTPAFGALGILAYVAAFDTWFFWSHWVLHESTWLWENIHYGHHQYKSPSAFAQFAVHPFEAILQGPIGHFLVLLFCPVHPIQLAIMGALSSAWAFAAHDGRGDLNSHRDHHTKGRGRKFYFNLGFLTPTWDVIMGTRWYPEHPLWLEWQARKAGIADTRDGKEGGTPNDAFGVFKEAHKAKEL